MSAYVHVPACLFSSSTPFRLACEASRERTREQGAEEGENLYLPLAIACGSRVTSVRLLQKDAMFS